jgi:hypothetical protein
LDPAYRKPRFWSNLVLKTVCTQFSGSGLNCSGWADEDKFGGHYRDYFPNLREYSVSNLGGGSQEGMYSEIADSIDIDLEAELGPELVGRFDVVLSHTVLEHVFDLRAACRNLSALTRDALIVVVPWMQEIHTGEGEYGDYWRFSPAALTKLFEPHGLKACYHIGTDIPGSSCYFISVLLRQPSACVAMQARIVNGNDMYNRVRVRNALSYVLGRGVYTTELRRAFHDRI